MERYWNPIETAPIHELRAFAEPAFIADSAPCL